MPRVLIFGKFDVLHPGHIFLIKNAQRLGEVVAIVESDGAALRHGGQSVWETEKERLASLKSLQIKTFLRQAESLEELIKKFSPKFICLGYDQKWLIENISILNKTDKSFQLKILPAFKPELFKSSKIKSILSDPLAKVYLLNKPRTIHSFATVATLRKILQIKKIGFSGTLDPLASGLMILASGRATRLLDWFHYLSKTYVAQITFGQSSDTDDLEGVISVNRSAKKFDKNELEKHLTKFLGLIEQQVPNFSAKKVAGQKLHELARRGKEVKAPSAKVNIYSLKIIKFKYPDLKLEVNCSAGTYIRSLARDLGQSLGTGALLSGLERTAIGPFKLPSALDLSGLNKQDLDKQALAISEVIRLINSHISLD